MKNNIYIGNRYVPVFADPVEWNNLREYEPLTIVTYQGTAYTSRKTVPVGTALNNTDYWVVTGNYNAQVEAYRQETQALAALVNKCVRFYNTVADMKKDTVPANSIVKTAGYYQPGDGGGAFYQIVTTQPTNVHSEQVTGGYAALIDNGRVNFRSLGAKADGTNCKPYLVSFVATYPESYPLYVPSGVYTFTQQTTFTKRVNIIGEEFSYTDTDKTMGSIFMFTGLGANVTALTLAATKNNLVNIGFYSDSYTLSDDRSRCAKNVDVFTQTINTANVNGVVLKAGNYGGTVSNCRFRGWSGIGLNSGTFAVVKFTLFWECMTGLQVTSDNQVIGCRFFFVNTGIGITGSSNTILMTRMDSIRTNGITVNGGYNLIDDANFDYCQYNAIVVGNGRGNVIKGIQGRVGTIYPYDSSTDGDISAFSPTPAIKENIAMVKLVGYSNHGCSIEVPVQPRNPMDSTSTLNCSLYGVVVTNAIDRVQVVASRSDEYYTSGTWYTDYFDKALTFGTSASASFMINYGGRIVLATARVTGYSDLTKLLCPTYAAPTT